MIKAYKRTIKEGRFEEINDVKDFSSGSWINVVNPTVEELEDVFRIVGIGRENIENVLDENETARLEKDGKNLLIYVRVPSSAEQEVNTTPITIILNKAFLVTISIYEHKIFNKFLDGSVEFFTTQKSKLLINFFLQIVERYEKHIRAISKKVVGKKGKLNNLRNEDIVNLVEIEEDLNDFIASLVPNINVFEKILTGRYIKLYEEDQELVQDLLIDAKQVLDLCKTNIKNIINIRGAYSTIISNDLNKTMKFLASITVILTVPTIIASIFGMNVSLPLADSPLAFVAIMAVTVSLIFTLYFLFIKRRWL